MWSSNADWARRRQWRTKADWRFRWPVWLVAGMSELCFVGERETRMMEMQCKTVKRIYYLDRIPTCPSICRRLRSDGMAGPAIRDGLGVAAVWSSSRSDDFAVCFYSPQILAAGHGRLWQAAVCRSRSSYRSCLQRCNVYRITIGHLKPNNNYVVPFNFLWPSSEMLRLPDCCHWSWLGGALICVAFHPWSIARPLLDCRPANRMDVFSCSWLLIGLSNTWLACHVNWGLCRR